MRFEELHAGGVGFGAGAGQAGLGVKKFVAEWSAGLAVKKDGAMLRLFDENGKGRAVLGVIKDVPGLSLRDENDKLRVTLVVDANGSGLLLVNENGEVIWRAP